MLLFERAFQNIFYILLSKPINLWTLSVASNLAAVFLVTPLEHPHTVQTYTHEYIKAYEYLNLYKISTKACKMIYLDTLILNPHAIIYFVRFISILSSHHKRKRDDGGFGSAKYSNLYLWRRTSCKKLLKITGSWSHISSSFELR